MTAALDPHASKISPNDPRLKPRLSRVRYLRKAPTLIALAVVVVAVAISVVFATAPRERRARDELATFAVASRLPTEILDAPDVVPPKAAVEVAPAPIAPAPVYDVPATTPLSDRSSFEAQRRQRTIDDYLKARRADMFVQTRGLAPTHPDGEPQAEQDLGGATAGGVVPRLPPARQALAELAPAEPSRDDFLAHASEHGDGYLHARLQRPRSPFELKAGAIIPAALQTGINSELVGPVFARVRENVYDSISHEHILIPQNAILEAAYDARVAWGQQRVLLCWKRIIFPNGTSLPLGCMPGADLTGAAGLTGEVDEHWWRLAKGAALASLLSAGTAAAGGNTTGFNATLPQQFARGAGNEFGRAGEQVTRRELMVPSTIAIPPGDSVNALVTEDMILEPYPVDMPGTDDDEIVWVRG